MTPDQAGGVGATRLRPRPQARPARRSGRIRGAAGVALIAAALALRAHSCGAGAVSNAATITPGTLAAAAPGTPRGPGAPRGAPLELWLYYPVDLSRGESLIQLERVWRRAAAAGYRHVLIADPKFARLGDMPPTYFANAARAKQLAGQLGLEIVPAVFQVGRSNSLLAHDPNLAEGLPVHGAHFVVHAGEARAVTDPPVALRARPDFSDPSVQFTGPVARMSDHAARARFAFRLRVAPFRVYHVSVRIRTADYGGRPLVQAMAGEHALNYLKTLGVRPSQDWTVHDIVFNSLDRTDVTLWFGCWGAARGTVEWTDWRIEEAGLVNVLRRPGAPCTVTGYQEGRDYQPIRDATLGVTPWPGQYEAWHEPPPIRTTLPEGTRLEVSWYAPAVLFNGQVTCCPSEPATLELLRDEARRVRQLWGAGGAMMMHDEIRALNWDASCRARGRSAGEVLAAHLRDCTALLAGSTAYVWGDMFDPYQNAHADYYLVNGDLGGSWEGLDRDVVVVNWNFGRRDDALRFFAERGHRQLIAGYYDGPLEDARAWLESARRVKGVVGMMYTTWQERYDDLEAFARICGAPAPPAEIAR